MHHIHRVLISVVAFATSACVGSLDAVVPEDAAFFDPRLLGTWDAPDSSEHAVITRGEPLQYAIEYTDSDGKPVSLIGRLGRARDRFILDVQPTGEALGPYRDLVVRLHIALILDSIGPRTTMAILEPDSLDAFLRAHPGAIAHLRGDGGKGLVLTATSRALQPFFAMYLQRPGALASASTWARRADP